ncbi:hypothetical protein B566_EDAN004222, partial [Ephemera danica]
MLENVEELQQQDLCWAGRSHSGNFTLFRLGERASLGLKVFAETGRSESLDSAAADSVLDQFQAPPITAGEGHVETSFFVDGNHSQVSLVTRIVPSPDWFIGLDSFELCVNANWIDSVTIELDPIDAGTDNGFTFTAPNWPTEPQGVVYRVTHTYPPHPAGSFYYPALRRLPAMATFRFVKLREYELTAEQLQQQAEGEVLRMEHVTRYHLVTNHEQTSRPSSTSTTPATYNVSGDPVAAVPLPAAAVHLPAAAVPLPRGNTSAIMNSIVQRYRNPHHRKRRLRPPRDCRVSEWGAWGECSKSCGIGEMQRRREVMKHARRGGKPCPELLETRWCGSARSCSNPYFKEVDDEPMELLYKSGEDISDPCCSNLIVPCRGVGAIQDIMIRTILDIAC